LILTKVIKLPIDAASTCITVASLAKPSYQIASPFVCRPLVRQVSNSKLYYDVSPLFFGSMMMRQCPNAVSTDVNRRESGMRLNIIVAAP
jgi:hypothetical protein